MLDTVQFQFSENIFSYGASALFAKLKTRLRKSNFIIAMDYISEGVQYKMSLDSNNELTKVKSFIFNFPTYGNWVYMENDIPKFVSISFDAIHHFDFCLVDEWSFCTDNHTRFLQKSTKLLFYPIENEFNFNKCSFAFWMWLNTPFVAVGCSNGKIEILNLKKREIVGVLQKHNSRVLKLVVNEQTQELLSLRNNWYVDLWCLKEFKLLNTFDNCCSFFENFKTGAFVVGGANFCFLDNDHFAVADSKCIIQIFNKKQIETICKQVYWGRFEEFAELLYSTKLKLLIVCFENTIKAWELEIVKGKVTLKDEIDIRIDYQLTTARLLENNTQLLFGTNNGFLVIFDLVKQEFGIPIKVNCGPPIKHLFVV